MELFWILGPAQTKTGMGLAIEDGELLTVRSGCCGSRIYRDVSYVCYCTNCDVKVAGKSTWSPDIQISEPWDNNPCAWVLWLEFWFGLKDAEMKIEWA